MATTTKTTAKKDDTAAKAAPKAAKADPKSTRKPARRGAEKTLADLLEHGMKDMLYAERKIYKALPKMIRAAEDETLRAGLEQHREETQQQIEMLQEAFEHLGKRARGERCDAIEGILEEGDSLLEDFGDTVSGDAAIIFSCQAVEHYEIARYGSLRAYAEALGHAEIAALMQQILDQETAANDKLSQVATDSANPKAAAGVEGEAEDEDMDDADGDDMDAADEDDATEAPKPARGKAVAKPAPSRKAR